MVSIRARSARTALFAHIALTVAIAGATNVVLRALGWSQPQHEIWPAFAPRGGTIGAIWVVLFGCMGAARVLVARGPAGLGATNATLVTGLIAACLAYPFYTHLLPGHLTELSGNIATLAFAVAIIARVRRDSPFGALLIAFVGAWIICATALVIALVQLNGWQTSA